MKPIVSSISRRALWLLFAAGGCASSNHVYLSSIVHGAGHVQSSVAIGRGASGIASVGAGNHGKGGHGK